MEPTKLARRLPVRAHLGCRIFIDLRFKHSKTFLALDRQMHDKSLLGEDLMTTNFSLIESRINCMTQLPTETSSWRGSYFVDTCWKGRRFGPVGAREWWKIQSIHTEWDFHVRYQGKKKKVQPWNPIWLHRHCRCLTRWKSHFESKLSVQCFSISGGAAKARTTRPPSLTHPIAERIDLRNAEWKEIEMWKATWCWLD